MIDMREICPTCTRYRDAECSGLEFRWESCEDLIEYEVEKIQDCPKCGYPRIHLDDEDAINDVCGCDQ